MPSACLSGSSLAFLKEGDKIPLRDLLYALLLPSGDDAAVAIADGVAGSQATFVALDERRGGTARPDRHALHRRSWSRRPRLRLCTPDGLDFRRLYTTAADLAHLAAFAMRSPLFAAIVGTPHYTLAATATHAAYDWSSTNDFFSTFAYDGVTGVKTGSEVASGYCLVFSATRAQGHLLGAVLHDGNFDDPDPNEYFWCFMDATTLLDWGFSQQLAVAQHWTSIPSTNAP